MKDVNAFFPQGEFKVQKEAVWTVANFTTGGTVDQLVQLVQAGVLEPLINLLDIQDTKMVIIILDVIFFILQVSSSEQVGCFFVCLFVFCLFRALLEHTDVPRLGVELEQ